MSKENNSVQIYNFLAQEYPSLFRGLRVVPDAPKEKVDNQPQVPKREIRVVIEILPGDNFESIVAKLCELNGIEPASLQDTSKPGFTLRGRMDIMLRKQITSPTVPIDYNYDYCQDDDTDDDDDFRNDHTDDREYSQNLYQNIRYGNLEKIEIHSIMEDPAYARKMDDYRDEMKQWENRRKSRASAKQKIKSTVEYNKQQIKNAIENHSDLWIMAAKHLFSENRPADWINKKLERAEAEIARLKALQEEFVQD